MIGAEHYREAERLLSDASFTGTHGHPVNRDGDLLQPGQQAALIARAQVHADLANAAAAVLPTIVRFMGDSDEVTRWAKATGAYDESAPDPLADGVTDQRAAAGSLPSGVAIWTALVGQDVTVILANRRRFYGQLLSVQADVVRVEVTSPRGETGATEWLVDDIDSINLEFLDPNAAPTPTGWPPRIGDVWEIDRKQYWACGRPSEPRLLTPTGESCDAEYLRQSATSVKLVHPGRERATGGDQL